MLRGAGLSLPRCAMPLGIQVTNAYKHMCANPLDDDNNRFGLHVLGCPQTFDKMKMVEKYLIHMLVVLSYLKPKVTCIKCYECNDLGGGSNVPCPGEKLQVILYTIYD